MSGNWMIFLARLAGSGPRSDSVAILALATPVATCIACAPLFAHSLVLGGIVLVISSLLFYWLPVNKGFERGKNGWRVYVYKPSQFVDAWDDPESQYWLIPGAPAAPTGLARRESEATTASG